MSVNQFQTYYASLNGLADIYDSAENVISAITSPDMQTYKQYINSLNVKDSASNISSRANQLNNLVAMLQSMGIAEPIQSITSTSLGSDKTYRGRTC
jgi:hypothetical protein